VTQDDTTFFLTIATIAATLLGLTFLALSVFMVDVLRRYDCVALPVFRERDAPQRPQRRMTFLQAGLNILLSFVRRCKCKSIQIAQCLGKLLRVNRDSSTEGQKVATPDRDIQIRPCTSPESLTDYELFDGDPLVVFIAFSAAVSWNLFLMPLALSLTAALSGSRVIFSGLVMILFLFFLTFSFSVRQKKLDQLRPYLTHEELLWPVFHRIAWTLYFLATLVVLLAGLSLLPKGANGVSLASLAIKLVCATALLAGTYTVNKDMFVFFKAVGAERMRVRWVEAFFKETYPRLAAGVEQATSDGSWEHAKDLATLWGSGPRVSASSHVALRGGPVGQPKAMWSWFVERHKGARTAAASAACPLVERHCSAPDWMLDIPSISQWSQEVAKHLNDYGEYRKGVRP
jgi:hypothetical protein